METIYKKVGRRYVEIGVCDRERDYWQHGTHLVVCNPGSRFTQYNIEPKYAETLAVLMIAKEAMTSAMVKANTLRPQSGTRLTDKQLKIIAEAKLDNIVWHGPSMFEIVEAGINAVIEKMKESEK